MRRRLTTRLSIVLAAFAVAAASVLPAFPAVADDSPTPTPSVTAPASDPTPDATPSSDPTTPPATDPTPDATGTPSADPTPSETPAPADSATPTPTPSSTPAAATVSYSGDFQRISTEDDIKSDGNVLFQVEGYGFLNVNVSQLPGGIAPQGTVTATFQVPTGMTLLDDPAGRFQQLAISSSTKGALVALKTRVTQTPQTTQGLVNVTPIQTVQQKIYAVLVTPAYSGAPNVVSANQTSGAVATDVADASTFWSLQSHGQITFSLAGTTSWYKSANVCNTQAGSTALWTQAASIASTQLGYVPGRNTHLVLFFPSTANCGGAIGLASVGQSVNKGGVAWVIGTTANAIEEATLKHEIGHNLSLGHADWLPCGPSSPDPGYGANQGCGGPDAGHPSFNYGDLIDVMGFGDPFHSGGSLSAPQAIRSGMWTANTDYKIAPTGTNSYVLKPVSAGAGNAGVGNYLGVVVQDAATGGSVNYFVEYRNFTGNDAQYSDETGTCNPGPQDFCVGANAPGIRILRMEPTGYEGVPGGDTYLIGRSSGQLVRYTAVNDQFTTLSGVTIKVTAISSTQATVQVVRPGGTTIYQDEDGSGDYVHIAQAPGYDGLLRVGDSVIANLGDYWNADTYTFQWKRDGVNIAGATSQTYTLTPADLNTHIDVYATGTTGAQSVTGHDDDRVSAATGMPSGWVHTANGWLVNAGPIFINTGAVSLTGTATVGQALAAHPANSYKNFADAAVVPTSYNYQWLRNGVAIAGATGSGYTLVAADYNTAIKVRVTPVLAGYVGSAADSAASALVIKGTIVQNNTPTISIVGSVLQASAASAITSEPGVAATYQWQRNGVNIASATAQNYVATAADLEQNLSVHITVTKLNYNNLVVDTAAGNYSVRPTGSFGISGTTQVGQTLTAGNTTFTDANSVAIPAVATFQWYRKIGAAAPVAIAGATASTYALVAADYNATISYKENGTLAPLAPWTATSGQSAAVVKGVIAGSQAGPTIARSGTFGNVGSPLTLTASRQAGDITETGVAFANQWYRDGVAIAGATTMVYKPTAADQAHTLSFQITVTKLNYTTVVLDSSHLDYSVVTVDSPSVQGTLQVGQTVNASTMNFSETPDGTIAVTPQYQWFRNGVAIAGAISDTYQVVFADLNTKLSYRITAPWPGYVSYVGTSPLSATVIKGVFGGLPLTTTESQPTGQVVSAGHSAVYASVGSITTTWQWFRNGVPIVGATGAVYTLQPADYNTNTSVSATVNDPGYETATATSTPQNFSVIASPTQPVIVGEQRIGVDLTVASRTYTLAGWGSISADLGYVWYRDGVAIPGVAGNGATFAHYTTTNADVGKAISVTVSAGFGGNYQPAIQTSLPTQKLAAYSLPGYSTALPAVVQTPNTLQLTLPGTGVTDPTATTAYQWLRDGVVITGATAASYTMTAPDAGRLISVRATISKALYTTVVKLSPGINYSIQNHNPAAIIYLSTSDDHGEVGATINVYGFSFETKDENPLTGDSKAYQWLRNGVAIAGATGAAYTVVGADLNTTLSVRVVVSKPGYLPLTVIGAGLGGPFVISAGTFDVSSTFQAPTVNDSASGVLSATFDPATAVSPGVPTVYTYKWLRDGVTTIGTAATYQLTAADQNHTVSLAATATKPFFTSHALAVTAPVDYTITGSGLPGVVNTSFGGGPRVGDRLDVATGSYTAGGGSITPTSFGYQWLRAGVAIPGATFFNYDVQAADIGKALSVRVTTFYNGFIPLVATSPAAALAVTGTITGDQSKPTVVASPTGLLSVHLDPASITNPLNPTLSIKWYRVAAPANVLLATAPTYQLTAANRLQQIYVVVVASAAGMTPATWPLLPSDPTDYSLSTNAGPTLVASSLTIGDTFSVNTSPYPVSPTFTYLWGHHVGASFVPFAATALTTGPTYVATLADLNTLIQVRVTASYPGMIADVQLSSSSSPVGPDTFAGSHAVPDLAVDSVTNKVTASLPGGSISTLGATYTYKWYRGAVQIAGETTAVHQLTTADLGPVTVTVTVTKPGFTTLNLSSSHDYGISPNGPGNSQITGTALTGQILTASVADGGGWFDHASATPVTPSFTAQWFRQIGAAVPVAIAGATSTSYELTSADFGAKITARVTANLGGYAPYLAPTSASTAVVAKGSVLGSFTGATVVPGAGNGTVKVTLPVGWATTTGVTYTYQWLRAGTNITGATAATYVLTAADVAATQISVNVTASKLNLNPVTAASDMRDVTMTQTAPSISGSAEVGSTLSATVGSYSNAEGAFTTAVYQWLRNNVAIAGATGPAYVLTPTDLNTNISARVTPVAPGSIGVASGPVVTSNVLGPVVMGTFTGTFAAPDVALNSATNVLTGSVSAASVSPSPVVAYQWKRDGVAIVGATAATYHLAAADYAHLISLHVAVSRPSFNPAPAIADSAQVDYSMYIDTSAAILGTPAIGQVLSASGGTYKDILNNPVAGAVVTFSWYWSVGAGAHTLIAGATAPTLPIPAAYLNYNITSRVTYAAPGYVGSFQEHTAGPVVMGTFGGSHGAPLVTPLGQTLAATIPGGTITDPSPTYSYQWFSNGVAIVGGTAATHVLVAADYTKVLHVHVKVTKAGYTTLDLPDSPNTDYSIVTTGGTPYVNGTPGVGNTLTLTIAGWSVNGGAVTPTVAYQWLRDGATVIAGATASTYVPGAADVGHTLSVRYTPSLAGAIGAPLLSGPSGVVAIGTLSGSYVTATVVENNPAMTLTASLTPGSITDSGIAIAYQWLRDGVAIPLATAATYTLVAADNGPHDIHVRLRVTKAGYTTVDLFSNGATYWLGSSTTITSSGPSPLHPNGVLQLTPGVYDYTPSGVYYQWYRKVGAAAATAIVGNLGTGATYTVVPGDVGANIYAVVTATYPGYFPNVQTVAPSIVVTP